VKLDDLEVEDFNSEFFFLHFNLCPGLVDEAVAFLDGHWFLLLLFFLFFDLVRVFGQIRGLFARLFD